VDFENKTCCGCPDLYFNGVCPGGGRDLPIQGGPRAAAFDRLRPVEPSENILYAEDAGLTKFNEFFGSERDYRGRLFKYVKAGVSQVFVYYVGHGAPDLETNEAYFVPVDANPQDLKANGYRLQTFGQWSGCNRGVEEVENIPGLQPRRYFDMAP